MINHSIKDGDRAVASHGGAAQGRVSVGFLRVLWLPPTIRDTAVGLIRDFKMVCTCQPWHRLVTCPG